MKHEKIILVVLAALVAACKVSAPNDRQAMHDLPSAATSNGNSASPSQGKSDMSPLESVLTVFASKGGERWDSYNNIRAVQWRDSEPIENPDSIDLKSTHYRSGNLLLSGFGVVEVPDGNLGVAAGTKHDNEGNSGITLNGDANSVHDIGIVKFYPSEKYQDILQQQLGASGSLVLIADQCSFDYGTTAANTQKNKFYAINLAGDARIYAEAYLDEEGGQSGPGSTTFLFYRAKPVERIARMRCQDLEDEAKK